MKSKLFSLIVSVLAAMCLWVYVMTVVNPDVDLVIGNIPVTFSGAEVLQEDHGLVITGDYQEFVSVHFYGKTPISRRSTSTRTRSRPLSTCPRCAAPRNTP